MSEIQEEWLRCLAEELVDAHRCIHKTEPWDVRPACLIALLEKADRERPER